MTAQEPGYKAPDISLIGDEHVRRYEETDGEVGHEWNGATCLVLIVKGAHDRSGPQVRVDLRA
jgi:hypothetical protein